MHPVPRRWSEIANAWQSHRHRHFTRIHTCATEHMPFLGRILVTGFSFQTLNVNRGTKKTAPAFIFSMTVKLCSILIILAGRYRNEFAI